MVIFLWNVFLVLQNSLSGEMCCTFLKIRQMRRKSKLWLNECLSKIFPTHTSPENLELTLICWDVKKIHKLIQAVFNIC